MSSAELQLLFGVFLESYDQSTQFTVGEGQLVFSPASWTTLTYATRYLLHQMSGPLRHPSAEGAGDHIASLRAWCLSLEAPWLRTRVHAEPLGSGEAAPGFVNLECLQAR